MELKKAMNIRKSVRSYTGETISEEDLEEILTAAYEAPVGMGKYDGIHLTAVTDQEMLRKLDSNAAKFFGNPSIHPLYGAPMLIVVSSDTVNNVASANVGFILQNMSLAAVEKGDGQCIIYGAVAALAENKDLVKELGIPEGYTPLGGITLGKTSETYTQRQIPDAHRYTMNRI